MSKRVQDLTGQRFGRWIVLQCAGRGKHGELQYKCRCECGTERTIRRSSLTSGNSKSCGCLSRDITKKLNTSHGATHTRLYRIWAGIIQRCCNSRKRYEWEKYGGRGISVCDEWKNSNKRTSKYISFKGGMGTIREFADKYGLAYSCLYARLKHGWSVEKALLTPSKKGASA